jgi:Protein of unknown function (DUF3631)
MRIQYDYNPVASSNTKGQCVKPDKLRKYMVIRWA